MPQLMDITSLDLEKWERKHLMLSDAVEELHDYCTIQYLSLATLTLR